MIASTWPTLSGSSKQALRFASAAAQERTSGATSNTALDEYDLLVGMMLSHPSTSEAERTFHHFDLVAGQALPLDYPTLTFDGLQKRLADQSPDAIPATNTEVDQILATAQGLATDITSSQSESDGVTPLRAVWAALLQTSNQASSAIRLLLDSRGVNSSAFVTALQSWVSTNDPDYESFLKDFTATPVDVVNYKADQAMYQAASGTPDKVEDYVGVTAEVDAFAYLLASRNLTPPLAMGLFGDWGSGKSFFLDAIRRRIDQLTLSKVVSERRQSETRFWKHIVQVEFNAWHYVEGDLWSSLVDHIFSQMNVASDKGSDDVVLRRQRYLLAKLQSTKATEKQLDATKAQLQADVNQRKQAVTEKTAQQEAAIQALEAARTNLVAVELTKQLVGGVGEALAAVKLDHEAQPDTLGEQAAALQTARDELSRASALLRPFLKQPGWLALILVLLIATPVIAFGIQQLSNSTAVSALSGVASLVVVLGGAVAAASRWVHRRLDNLTAAQVAVDGEIRRQREIRQTAVDKAQAELKRAADALERAERQQDELRESLASIEFDLAKTPQRVLNEFLRERLQAGEYRQRLGVPAIIRRDFRDLANLIAYQNAYLTEQSDKRKQEIRAAANNQILDENSDLIINRIILYIDDLDRCPDAKVVEVLQAVHMLLAFPLFVVVVAVDARWLASALQNRYPALAGGSPARPNDYLEKIFQIPFWVSSLNDETREKIVRGLLGPHVSGTAATGPGSDHVAPSEVDDAAAVVLREMINNRTGPPLLDIAALQVTADELAFLGGLKSMLGATPRSVKRFVNLYQLLKILLRSRPVAVTDPPNERIAALLLAMSQCLPGVFNLVGKDPGRTLGELARDASPGTTDPKLAALAAERACLDEWLGTQAPVWRQVDAMRLEYIARDVRRFLFQRAELEYWDPQLARAQLVHVIQEH